MVNVVWGIILFAIAIVVAIRTKYTKSFKFVAFHEQVVPVIIAVAIILIVKGLAKG